MNRIAKFRIQLIKQLIDFNERIFFERKLRAKYRSIFNSKLKCVIDVGANKGQSIDFFLSINPQCKIFAIEPNQELFKSLQSKYSNKSNIQLFNFGISSIEGEKMFHENIFDYTSSFETLNNESAYLKKKSKVLGVKPENIINKSYLVPVITLDSFISNNNLAQIDILKIDTEGHEFDCLSGLFTGEKNQDIKYIQIESHNDDMYQNRKSFSEIKQLLNNNSFFELFSIHHGFGDFDEIVFKNSNVL
jgi:FkbM family methyltransferase